MKKLKHIKDLNAYDHKITWIHKHSHKRNEKVEYFVNISSALLASVGVITVSMTVNTIVLAALTTAGILLKGYHEFKNIKGKTYLLKFSVTSYVTSS